ncbi:hemoglobin [Micromonospora pallida]|uniref:Group 1 truncated hemoglobin n=1 Tax=Micromonospora pallida TaxID=145854 RepID=A0A1C6RPU2_9ACTN|nr:group 1 truncated hemoglobin [Micromonospora pallida]SCL19202.1 hemoglobin [Micromonospora pallida]
MSIYDSIGGAPAVQATLEDFYARVLADRALVSYFDGVDMRRLKAHQRSFLTAALGGAEIYAGRDMATAHARLAITDEAFDAVVDHLVDTLTGLGVPAETIAEIGAELAPLRQDIVTSPAVSPSA